MAGSCSCWRRGCCCSALKVLPASLTRSWGAASICFARAAGRSFSATAQRRPEPEAARAPRPQGSANPRCPPENGSDGDIRRRAERATALAHLGKLSAAAKALTASPLAPASAQTLAALRDPERRPPAAQVPLDPNLGPCSVPAAALSRDRLLANLRRAGLGAAAGPSGCTNEHLRVLLDDEVCSELLASAAARLAGADLPPEAADALRLGRMVALTKPTGGVRALVMGDVFRRLVARTLAQQFGEHFRMACAPFQYALSTRARPEALVRALRAATEADPRTTVLSIDGVGAFDHISRASMLGALRSHA